MDITGEGVVGGLVGTNGYDGKGTVSNCYSTGTVTGGAAGGLVGHNGIREASVIENCYSSVNVDASDDDIAGGLVGKNGLYNDDIVVSNSYSTGDVTGDRSVGGLVGSNWGANIENCYSTGSVSGNLYRAGGLVGQNTNDVNSIFGWERIGRISNSYSTGDVTGDRSVGGFVGKQDNGIISNCYSASENVVGSFDVGGFAGAYNDGSFENSLWDNEVCDQSQDFSGGDLENVYAKSTSEMITKSTFTDYGWDFSSTWNIDEGSTYPYLQVNEQTPHPGQPDPVLISTDSNGIEVNTFAKGDFIYMSGEYFEANADYEIYVVDNSEWTKGTSLSGENVCPTVTVTTDENGDFRPTMVWGNPGPGHYDAIADDGDTTYEGSQDVIDDYDVSGAGIFVVPEPSSILAVLACLGAMSLLVLKKRG